MKDVYLNALLRFSLLRCIAQACWHTIMHCKRNADAPSFFVSCVTKCKRIFERAWMGYNLKIYCIFSVSVQSVGVRFPLREWSDRKTVWVFSHTKSPSSRGSGGVSIENLQPSENCDFWVVDLIPCSFSVRGGCSSNNQTSRQKYWHFWWNSLSFL